MENTLNTIKMNTANDNTKNAAKRLLATMWFEENFKNLSEDSLLPIVVYESRHTYYDKKKGCAYKLTACVNIESASESLVKLFVTANGNIIDTDGEVVVTLDSDCVGDLVLACDLPTLEVFRPHLARVRAACR